jgi:DNA-binding transcriptional regulator YiaG
MYCDNLGQRVHRITWAFSWRNLSVMATLVWLSIITKIFLSPVGEFVSRLSTIETKTAGDELTWIAGSVVLSDTPPQQLKHWRKKFGIKQADLARKMDITPSVLSDYEKGRRPSPGVNFIKRYLLALYELARANGHSDKDVVPTSIADANISQPQ